MKRKKYGWEDVIKDVVDSFDFVQALQVVKICCPSALKVTYSQGIYRVADDHEQIDHLRILAVDALLRVCQDRDQTFGHYGVPFCVHIDYLGEIPEIEMWTWTRKGFGTLTDELLKSKGLWSKIVKRDDKEKT